MKPLSQIDGLKLCEGSVQASTRTIFLRNLQTSATKSQTVVLYQITETTSIEEFRQQRKWIEHVSLRENKDYNQDADVSHSLTQKLRKAAAVGRLERAITATESDTPILLKNCFEIV